MTDAAPSLDTPTLHPTYVRLLCMALRGSGVDVNDLLQRCQLGDWKSLVGRDAMVAHRAANALIQEALRVTGKPWLGLEFGAGMQISAHGPLGYAAVAGSNLRQALQVVANYVSIRHAGIRFRLQETAHGASFSMVERMDMGASREFIATMLFAAILRLMESVVGHPMERLKADLPILEPMWRSHLAHVFKGEIRFGAERLTFHLDHAMLALPCMTADAAAFAQACMECEKLKSRVGHVTLTERLQQLFAGREGHYPALADAARFFSLSPRTLIRKLKEEGTSFQSQLDTARQTRAMWLLSHTRYSVEDIAARLGYGDTTNFSRTCRRWFGQTPSDIRSQMPSGPV